ncbi:hypothetical protein ACG02S_10285 [Roseateles sp. DC23W]|uniref:Uncharacterized protein n=1 Tax=Pelomonas dachongensis TaxID=3299029 RepID=A0ABW7ENL4_9BURK
MKPSSWPPLLTAFTIWFVHFMACWAAGELVWPQQRAANATAWAATALALLALGAHAVHLQRRHVAGALPGWQRRFAQGATALATVAVLFSALPAVVLLP